MKNVFDIVSIVFEVFILYYYGLLNEFKMVVDGIFFNFGNVDVIFVCLFCDSISNFIMDIYLKFWVIC